MPGTPRKKKRAGPAASVAAAAPKKAKVASAPSKKKSKVADASSKKKAKVAEAKVPRKPDPVAAAALRAAVQSAKGSGEMDDECLKRALCAGYSKFFVLAEVARLPEDNGDDGNEEVEWTGEENDLKPAAK